MHLQWTACLRIVVQAWVMHHAFTKYTYVSYICLVAIVAIASAPGDEQCPDFPWCSMGLSM